MIFSFSHHLQQDLGYSDVLGLDLLGFGIYVSGLGRTGQAVFVLGLFKV